MNEPNRKIGKRTWAVVAAAFVLTVVVIAALVATSGGRDNSSGAKGQSTKTKRNQPRAYEIARQDCYKAAASLGDPRHGEAMNDPLAFALHYAQTHTYGPRRVVSEGCVQGLSEGKAYQ